MNTQEICALISGGFFEEKTQCLVAVEIVNGSNECEMVATEAVTPKQPADVLMDELAKIMGEELSNVNVNVYGIAGGIIGKGIVQQREKDLKL